MPDKLTDNEIVKAMTCYINHQDCDECKYCIDDYFCNKAQICIDALDLINRLQAENERLESLSERLGVSVNWKADYIYELEDNLKTAKAEAYKEFAERLKEKAKPHYFDNCNFAVPIDDIDNLLKEMVGEDK